MSPKFALLVVFMALFSIVMGAHLPCDKQKPHAQITQVIKQETIQVMQNPITSIQTSLMSKGPASSIVQVPISESVKFKATKTG